MGLAILDGEDCRTLINLLRELAVSYKKTKFEVEILDSEVPDLYEMNIDTLSRRKVDAEIIELLIKEVTEKGVLNAGS